MRAALSMLGILIGVAAVVAMMALGRGAQEAIENQLSSLGSNLLVLRPGATQVMGVMQEVGAKTRLDFEDALSVIEKIEDVRRVSANVNGRGQVTFGNKNWSTQVLGAGANYAEMHALVPTIGRFFIEQEDRQRKLIAVIGMTVVRELFGNKNPLGEMIKINKKNFTVIGIFPEKGATGWRDQDDIIVIPVSTAMHRLLGKTYVDYIDLEIHKNRDMESAQASILELMAHRHRISASQQDEAYQIRNMADIQEAIAQSSKIMSLLLASIATISLLVGGIGIMNIMLVSVTERIKEIGLRKAIGARAVDILAQFLAESVVVTTVGGLFGILLGWVITTLLAKGAGWTVSLTWFSVLLAFGFSASVGIIFGFYPARRAAQLNPIESLRSE